MTPTMRIVPNTNWRGSFGSGSYLSGDVNTYPIVWPGFQRTAWHRDQPDQQQTKVWTGSLLEGQRDASGQIYMRNRYYDPVTGQFTQPDPIGLAGGLNAYGFAAGDPIAYGDPYGLYVCAQGRAMQRDIERAYRMDIEWGIDGCVRDPLHTTPTGGGSSQLQNEFDQMVSSPIRFDVKSVRFGTRGSQILRRSSMHYEIVIARFQYQESVFWDLLHSDRRRYGMMFGGECRMHTAMFSVYSLIVHELGHAFEATQNRDYRPEAPAVRRENMYHEVQGEPLRCGLPTETFQ